MKLTPLETWIVSETEIKEKTRADLEEYQLSKIKKVIKYVKKYSEFYSEYLKDIDEADIKSFKHFQKISFTLPEYIREFSNKFLCVPQREISRIVTLKSSGTSGEEKRIYFTENDLKLTVEFFKYGMRSLVNENDRVLVLLPGNSYGSIGDLLKKALDEINIGCYVYGILSDLKDAAEFIKNRKITCIVGIPTQVLHFSRIESETFKNNIRKILLSTDYVPETLITEITSKFQCKVFTHYGMTEMGYGGGVECEALNGYHMRENDLYFEIVDPYTGEVVKDGEYGEIVFTTLTREGMPLIRYRTGDLARFNIDSCACGTFLKTMSRSLGRIENRFEVGDSEFIYMRDLDELILSYEEVINYKVYVQEGNLICVYIAVKKEEDFYKIKQILEGSIKELVSANKKNLDVSIRYLKETAQVKNSMIKRKICDCRRDG
ncbi:DVU_1553 family AMP-dependent CoA ligase [Clostridium drakei]|uniref:AMP-binding protein n=1 Tax=Clostridium drakei TaxID=332101 RepID=A0A2U8DMI6_9CLOT|nr:AMP-binding protein [Clostridium drakei]AWI03631.1 AMP-binding protein [Clostridium drakei]